MSERQGFFSRRRLIIFGDIALVVIVLVGVVSYFLTKSTTCDFPLTMQIQPPLSEIVRSPTIRETPPPWPAESQGLQARMAAAQVVKAPTGTPDQSYTFQLRVFYKGQAVQIPSGVGHTSGFVASIHTDDATGTIHVDRNRGDPEISLGDFFAVWGVRMTSNSLGDACNQGNSVLRLFTGTTALGGDIGVQPISSSTDGTMYTLTFGTDAEIPAELRAKLAPEQLMPPQHPNQTPG